MMTISEAARKLRAAHLRAELLVIRRALIKASKSGNVAGYAGPCEDYWRGQGKLDAVEGMLPRTDGYQHQWSYDEGFASISDAYKR